MDNSPQTTPPPAPVAQPVVTPPATPLRPKPNTTPWIILSLLGLAILLTALAYIFVPQLTGKKTTITQTTTTSPTPDPNQAKMLAYNNAKYGYSFFYPATWKIAKEDADQKNVELHYVADPNLAIIKIQFLTPEERTKMPPRYCETSGDQDVCYTYQITEHSSAVIGSVLGPDRVVRPEAIISHPKEGTILMQVTDSNPDSDKTFQIIYLTLSFTGEQRLIKLTACPDTWPATGEYVSFNGVQILAKDIDAAWANKNCTK